MGASAINERLFGGAKVDPEAATRGFELGTNAGQLSAQTGPAAFFNQVIEQVDKRRVLEAELAKKQQEARASKIQGVLLEGLQRPEGDPLRMRADKMLEMINSNPSFAQTVGIDPSKNKPDILTQIASLNAMQGQNGSTGFAPGTTANIGRNGMSLNVPINREATGDEAKAIASIETFEPTIAEMSKTISGGKLFPEDSIERTLSQMAIDSGNALFTSMSPELQAFQGQLNSVKRYAFGEGGKNLTGTEKEIVYNLLNTKGKSDKQIVTDLNEAIKILKNTSNVYKTGIQSSGTTGAVTSMGTFKSKSGKSYERMSDGSVKWL